MSSSSRRLLAAIAVAAAPAAPSAALAQSMLLPSTAGAPATIAAPVKADGALRYALGAGGSYASGWTGTQTSANVGGEGVIATADQRLRFGARALWSRAAGDTSIAESTTLLLTEESQHRWRGNTWFRQKLSLFPALRAGENVRGIVDTGVAMALSPFCSIQLGWTQRLESGNGVKASDGFFTTGIALKLR